MWKIAASNSRRSCPGPIDMTMIQEGSTATVEVVAWRAAIYWVLPARPEARQGMLLLGQWRSVHWAMERRPGWRGSPEPQRAWFVNGGNPFPFDCEQEPCCELSSSHSLLLASIVGHYLVITWRFIWKWGYPKSSMWIGMFHCKPSIKWGSPIFRTPAPWSPTWIDQHNVDQPYVETPKSCWSIGIDNF
jgi:hypothetical protein